MNYTSFSDSWIQKLDETNVQFINNLNLANKLKEAVLYSYNAGGKRIRPLLLLSVVQGFGCETNKGLKAACALELIHTSSLIHDDLPAMDDDDYRRGKLTNHKVYGEATAILAGDALLINAFELLASDDDITDSQKVGLIRELSHCSGANGMIGGQQLDIENEDNPMTIDQLMQIHEHKTGKLLQFALVAGGIISDQTEQTLDVLRQSAYHIGIAFQIKDDILDVIGDAELIGKPVNSDVKNNKSTYVNLLGLQNATNTLQYHYDKAISLIDDLSIDSELIKEIYTLIIDRNK